MKLRFVIVSFAVALLLVAACTDDAEDIPPPPANVTVPPATERVTVTPTPEDEFEGFSATSFVTVTLTSEGVVVDPQQVDFGFLFLNLTNETEDVMSVRVHIRDDVKELLQRARDDEEEATEFGVAPGETRSEFVETGLDGPLKVFWIDDMLHVESVGGPQPSPSPELLACPAGDNARKGYVVGYFDATIIEAESGRLLDDSYMGDYARGYGDGYAEGVSDGHFGKPKEIGEDLRDYVVAYARGYEDGHEDGYALTATVLFPQDYRDHYFEGYFDAILDEGNLCGS